MGINEKIRNFISCAGVRISSMPLHFCGLISYLASGDGLLAWIMLKKTCMIILKSACVQRNDCILSCVKNLPDAIIKAEPLLFRLLATVLASPDH